ncbi:hypothetical protein [Chitinophaga sp. 212800010-3]|uniref:hypothetical protein n=1 Tax=unclassified Chitinophaga TaxID=2619133 RepID=UPI002DED8B23|nr:DUF615 domain-containing protein [Chitinophaga sp. 212800010-3]
MRKQLADIQEIDQYLLQEMPAAARLIFQARMLVSPLLREKVRQQQQVLQIVHWLGREKKREELQTIYQQLMNEPAFYRSVTSIFE